MPDKSRSAFCFRLCDLPFGMPGMEKEQELQAVCGVTWRLKMCQHMMEIAHVEYIKPQQCQDSMEDGKF